uniref:PsaI n=1 Tax=Symbiodinium sp. TaxID=2950 RepID=UPI0031F5DAC8
MARPGRMLLVALAAVLGLSYCFLSSPEKLPKAKGVDFNAAVAASAALPALTMLAEDAEAKYGDNRKWSAVLVPLTTLVFPAVAMGSFVLYSFQEDAFWRLVPGTKRAAEAEKAWREHPLFKDSKDPMFGLLNPDDYEKGLEEAWERAKPAGSTVTVKDKLKQLSKQDSPHWESWRSLSA